MTSQKAQPLTLGNNAPKIRWYILNYTLYYTQKQTNQTPPYLLMNHLINVKKTYF